MKNIILGILVLLIFLSCNCTDTSKVIRDAGIKDNNIYIYIVAESTADPYALQNTVMIGEGVRQLWSKFELKDNKVTVTSEGSLMGSRLVSKIPIFGDLLMYTYHATVNGNPRSGKVAYIKISTNVSELLNNKGEAFIQPCRFALEQAIRTSGLSHGYARVYKIDYDNANNSFNTEIELLQQ